MNAQTAINREIDGCVAFALFPTRLRKDRCVKRLAERLENLDLLAALRIAVRLGELLSANAIDELAKLGTSPKKERGHTMKRR